MPILRDGELDITSHSAEQTYRLGARLGNLLQAGDVVCLIGGMGAGKTAFSVGIGQGWGTQAPVTSPTYTIVHEHRRNTDAIRLYHLDCYRIDSLDDAASIGLDDIFDGDGTVIIEWADRIHSLLPPEYLWVDLRILEHTRRNFTMEAHGQRHETLLQEFRDGVFGNK